MSMRKQFVTTIESLLASDEKMVLLLGDIGVHGFKNAFSSFPDRVYNIGILEQATVGAASGLAMSGFIPVVHTIAPFIIERALEQIKLDFCYQKQGGNFISVGASYDYAALGSTHHCPADVGTLLNIPRMEVVLPGAGDEFDKLFRQAYNNGNPTYFRLSERLNNESYDVEFGKANVVKKGGRATVIAVGTALKNVLEACADLDVTILYYTTVAPFDAETLRKNCASGKILLCEPYYSGALAADIYAALNPKPVIIETSGVPRKFLEAYGKREEHDKVLGLTKEGITDKINKLINI